MSGYGLLYAAAGAYLALGLLVSAWRREAESIGAFAAWVALFGLWTIGAGRRWLPEGPGPAVALAVAWGAGTHLLALLGGCLGRRYPVRGWIWLLGPVHALGLAGIWLAAGWKERAARRRSAVREATLAEREKAEVERAAEPETEGEVHGAGIVDEAGDASGERASGEPAAQERQAGEDLEGVVALGETTVGEVMVPRSEMVALPETATAAEWAAVVRATRHPYLPVYRSELDDIAGYVRLGDLFTAEAGDVPVTRFLREARFVPETMRCDDLLRELVAQGERFAIVVDEFGGTAGFVRDLALFEILLGEMEQEPAEAEIVETTPGVYLAQADARLDDWNEISARALPEGDYETLAGLALARLGRIPRTGEAFEIEGTRWEVLAGTPRRIQRLRISLGGIARDAAGAGRGTPSAARAARGR